MKKRVMFVLNPKSGKGLIKSKLLDIIDLMVKGGMVITIFTTQYKMHGCELIKKRGVRYDYIVISGGDGTLSECIKGLMSIEKEKRPVIGYIPSGSTNDFAESLKLPKNMINAAKNILSGKKFNCDVGIFNDDYFIYIAAFGAFTDVSYDTPQDMKNILGHTAYILEGIKRVGNLQKYHMIITHDNGSVEGDFIYGMVSNTTSVGGMKNLGKEKVQLDDGLFEVILVKYPQNPMDIQMIVTGILTQDFTSKVFCAFKTSKASFTSESGVQWTLDGEYGGTHTNVDIENISQAFSIMAPEKSSKTSDDKIQIIQGMYKGLMVRK